MADAKRCCYRSQKKGQVPKEGTGGTKEKTLIEELDNGAVVFQGEIMNPNGTSYLEALPWIPCPTAESVRCRNFEG
ncbi:hypothetical protein IID62_07220 [candidate division KSB1 bacterium]|nr:hypothetical protein [candidate division KSB1 bacterium]